MKGMLKPLLGHFLNDFMRRILERSYSMIDFRTNPGPTSDPALVTLAHQGAAAYREEFDLYQVARRDRIVTGGVSQRGEDENGEDNPCSITRTSRRSKSQDEE